MDQKRSARSIFFPPPRNASKSLICSVLSFLSVLFVLSVPSVLSLYAQSVPGELNTQGRITDTQGNPINAPTSFAFSIWDQSSGGTSLWCEARTISVVNGVYWANLGDNGTPIPPSAFASSTTYLATNVAASGVICSGNAPSGGVQLSPRQRLVTVPYSFTAGSVVPEIAISTLDATATTPYGGVNVTTNVFVQGAVGVNTTNPGQALDVSGGIHVSSGIAAGSWVVGGCVNPSDPNDIMKPVGDLCVDVYEASVWSTPTGGTEYGTTSANYPCNGYGAACAMYARSVSGVDPSAYITWFQAAEACANNGKHLLSNAEWQVAATGTPSPGTSGSTTPSCVTSGNAAALTGNDTNCVSIYGMMDMVGNVWEWVADWGQYGQISQSSYLAWGSGTFTQPWPDTSGSWNVAGETYNGSAWIAGLPGALLRGGSWGDGAYAGVFAFLATYGPSLVSSPVGLRCGRRR